MKLLLIFLISLNLMAIDEVNIPSETKNQINMVLITLKSNKTQEEKKEEIIKNINNIIDFNIMSKIAIGSKYYNELSSKEQSKYNSIFIEKIKTSYYTKLELYTDQSIEYKDMIKTSANRIQMPIIIHKNKENYELIFKYYKNDKNDWKIYDIDVLGVSITQAYRTQIQDVLQKDKSFENLIVKLEKEG